MRGLEAGNPDKYIIFIFNHFNFYYFHIINPLCLQSVSDRQATVYPFWLGNSGWNIHRLCKRDIRLEL